MQNFCNLRRFDPSKSELLHIDRFRVFETCSRLIEHRIWKGAEDRWFFRHQLMSNIFFHEWFSQPIVSNPEISSCSDTNFADMSNICFSNICLSVRSVVFHNGLTIPSEILSHEHCWFHCYSHKHSPNQRMFFVVWCKHSSNIVSEFFAPDHAPDSRMILFYWQLQF